MKRLEVYFFNFPILDNTTKLFRLKNKTLNGN